MCKKNDEIDPMFTKEEVDKYLSDFEKAYGLPPLQDTIEAFEAGKEAELVVETRKKRAED